MPFDLKQLTPFIGGLSPGGGSAFMRGWARAQQEAEARKLREQQGAAQKEQLGFQRSANERANAADKRAEQDQLIQAVTSIRGLLEDPTIDDPTVYGQREQFATSMAPRLGVDAGFISSLRPAPTVFQQRQAKKKLDEIAKTYSAQQMAMLEADDQTGAAPVFEVGGEQLTIAQLRERAGTAAYVRTKGQGFLGPQQRPDGSVSSELSVGVNIDGKEIEIPTLVPTLTPRERQWLLTNNPDPKAIPQEIIDKAIAHARQRMAAGQSPFADGGLAPMSMRAPVKPDVPNTPEEQFYQRYASEQGAKSFNELPTAQQAAARKMWMQADDRPPQQMGNLPTPIARRANQIADAFKAEPMVRATTTVAEAYNFVNSLSDTSTSPADDQALIYAFAKAQDPESVVREGEYQTVQKYAQSWLDNFKFNAMRVLNNQEFLTPQARQQMKAAIKQRYLSRRQQYDNIRRSYAQQINRVTGQQDGDEYLIDYAGAFPATETPAPAPTPAGGQPARGSVPNPFRTNNAPSR